MTSAFIDPVRQEQRRVRTFLEIVDGPVEVHALIKLGQLRRFVCAAEAESRRARNLRIEVSECDSRWASANRELDQSRPLCRDSGEQIQGLLTADHPEPADAPGRYRRQTRAGNRRSAQTAQAPKIENLVFNQQDRKLNVAIHALLRFEIFRQECGRTDDEQSRLA